MSHRAKLTLTAALSLLLGIALSTAILLFLSGRLDPLNLTADPPALLQEIRELDELVTVKYTIQNVIGLEELKLPVGRERLLLIVQADVLAGVDLSLLHAASLEIAEANTVLVRLPPARIMHIVVDDQQTRVWDRQVTWWTPWVPYNPDLERQARLKGREAVEEAALEMGILEQARRQAESSIRKLLLILGAKSVTFMSDS